MNTATEPSPRCDCGQELWARQSINRGFCERCRIDNTKETAK